VLTALVQSFSLVQTAKAATELIPARATEPVETIREHDDDRLLQPCEAKTLFGVSAKTLRRWHALGLISARRTMGGQRRYWESEVRARAAELDEAVA
jgi:MerR family regulatory protein